MSSYLTPEKVLRWRIVKWTLANAQDQQGKKSKPNRLDWSLSCSPMIPQRTEHSWEAHSIETSSAPLNPAFHSFTMQLSYFLGETQRDSSGDRWWWGVYLNWKKKSWQIDKLLETGLRDNSERGRQEWVEIMREISTNKFSQASVLPENWWNVTNDNTPEREREREGNQREGRGGWGGHYIPSLRRTPHSAPTQSQNNWEGK